MSILGESIDKTNDSFESTLLFEQCNRLLEKLHNCFYDLNVYILYDTEFYQFQNYEKYLKFN